MDKYSDKQKIVVGLVGILIMLFGLGISYYNSVQSQPLRDQFSCEYRYMKAHGNQLSDFKTAFKTAKQLHIKYHDDDTIYKLTGLTIHDHGKTYTTNINTFHIASHDSYDLTP